MKTQYWFNKKLNKIEDFGKPIHNPNLDVYSHATYEQVMDMRLNSKELKERVIQNFGFSKENRTALYWHYKYGYRGLDDAYQIVLNNENE